LARALLAGETLLGIPLVGLLEIYNLSSQPTTLGEWVVALGMHLVAFAVLGLIVVAWRKMLR
jgi:hypothetical protein